MLPRYESCAERKPIFKNDYHRWLFLDILAEIVEAYKIEIHAYRLMTNHYHLFALLLATYPKQCDI